ncbi:MAG: hypothetical protein KF900_09350 [Bacteroidetes bacterium]|nr:hypothetical protein [Bacteroidota bacterium]
MISKNNYIQQTQAINNSELPDNLFKAHQWVLKATENGTNWNAYENPNIKKVIDTTIDKLNAFLIEQNNRPEKTVSTYKAPKHETSPQAKAKKEHQPKIVHVQTHTEDEQDIELVERIPEEIRFMRRYLAMNGKRKTKEDLLRFINALHRAIIEKRIRKTSPYAKQMEYIQDKLIKRYNDMKSAFTVQIDQKIILEFKALIAQQKIMPSVALIKRYISLNGKYGVKENAKRLMEAMTRAFDKGHITKKDKYIKVFDQMHSNLSQYVKNKSHSVLNIEEPELNGLNGVLEGCACPAMNSEPSCTQSNSIYQAQQKPNVSSGVMNSMDFKRMQFRTLGFVGKYRKLIGDPAKGFSAMVFGKPKMGKSFLCMDFAGYLARNHGKVLYVAREEGLDMTLQNKLNAKEVAHPNLYVSESIPPDLSLYDFIFFDSINSLKLSASDLEALRNANPEKSFVYVFQTTKEGNFRGGNEFQHNVDSVIEIPEKGLAIQNGRYNQGGEMRIFEEQEYLREAA